MHLQQGLRQGRAAIFSPAIGDYQFELDKTSSSGIAVLTTSHGLHKVSYDIKYTASNNFEVDIQVECFGNFWNFGININKLHSP